MIMGFPIYRKKKFVSSALTEHVLKIMHRDQIAGRSKLLAFNTLFLCNSIYHFFLQSIDILCTFYENILCFMRSLTLFEHFKCS